MGNGYLQESVLTFILLPVSQERSRSSQEKLFPGSHFQITPLSSHILCPLTTDEPSVLLCNANSLPCALPSTLSHVFSNVLPATSLSPALLPCWITPISKKYIVIFFLYEKQTNNANKIFFHPTSFSIYHPIHS